MRLESTLRRCVLAIAGTFLGVGAVLAAPAWSTLDNQQQALIKPALQSQGGDFDKLPEQRRIALVKGADRWLAMTPAERTTATQQLKQWQQLSNQQKVAVLERREQFRKLSPEQRKTLLETQKQFLEMPLQQQADLHNEFNDLRQGLDGLSSPGFTYPSTAAPGATVPLGLPTTPLPSTALGLPILPVLPH